MYLLKTRKQKSEALKSAVNIPTSIRFLSPGIFHSSLDCLEPKSPSSLVSAEIPTMVWFLFAILEGFLHHATLIVGVGHWFNWVLGGVLIRER